jgi:translation elongation factor EF-Tu-like GTPase
MAATWLFRVFDAFNVRGNGWVLLPGVPRDNPGVAVGDRIELRGGGPARTATVRGIGFFSKSGGEANMMPLLIDMDPTDKPLILGAEVWKVEPEQN